MKASLLTIFVVCFFSVCRGEVFAHLEFTNDTLYSVIGQEDPGNGPPGNIEVQKVIRDRSHNFLITGSIIGTVRLGDSLLTSKKLDYLVARFTPDGTLLWLDVRSSTGNEVGHAIALDKQGNIYVCGVVDDTVARFYGFPRTYYPKPNTEAILFSYDPSGHSYGRNMIATGPGDDAAFAVITDEWNNVYVTGVYRETAIICGDTLMSRGKGDMFLVKLSSNRYHIITRTYGTEWGDERGVDLTIGTDSSLINVIYDYNIAGGHQYRIWYDDYAMKDSDNFEICQACLEEVLKKELELQFNVNR